MSAATADPVLTTPQLADDTGRKGPLQRLELARLVREADAVAAAPDKPRKKARKGS